MRSKPTGQKRHLILVLPGTKEITQLQALPLAVARVPTFASYPSRTRQAHAPHAARQYSKSQSGCATLACLGQRRVYGLGKASGSRWKGLRDILPRPPGQSQWEPSGEEGQNSIENPMVPKEVIRRKCRETKERTRVSWKVIRSAGR
jgi:hypothetical protein